MASCCRPRCRRPARWSPVLVLRARGAPAPAKAQLTLGLCSEHKELATIDDFVGDEGWAQIAGAFSERGFAEPQRDLTSLEFVELS